RALRIYHLPYLFEVDNLLLRLVVGLLWVRSRPVVVPHVAQDADGADDRAVGVAQSGGVEGGGDDLAAGALGVEPGVAGDAPLHDLPEGGQELPGFIGGDDA